MSELLERLREDHMRLGKILGVLGEQLKEEYAGSLGRGGWLDHLAAVIDYIVEYPEAIHHPAEEVLFNKLVSKGLKPAERHLVELNLKEHGELFDATKFLENDLNKLLAGGPLSESGLREHAQRYVELQFEHMSREEAHLFPLAARLLDAEDWRTLATQLDHAQDPMFEQRLTRYESLFRFVVAGS